MTMGEKTLFQKIADREIPASLVHEDELCIALRDINPQAPTHILIVPRRPIASLDDLTENDAGLVGHLFVVARDLAAREGLTGGYRTVFNCGPDAGQSVDHIHLHLIGGRRLGWPPG
jgi:histidine triad (HIT) family protein